MCYGKNYYITNKLRRNFYIEKVIDLKSKGHNQILDIINNNDIETQEELADRCELTKGYISQLENDLTSPSISTLTDILAALGTNLHEFFKEEEEPQIVFTKDDYFEKEDTQLGSLIEWIIPNAQKNIMEPIRLTLKAGGSTYPDNPHEGEEFGYVLQGSIVIHIGNHLYKAKKGEAFYFAPKYKHYIE